MYKFWLLPVSFFLFLLWDIYHIQYGKVFDIAGILIVLFTFVMNLKGLMRIENNKYYLLVFMLPFVLLGFMYESYQESLVILIGFITVLVFSNIPDELLKLKLLKFAVCFLILAQIIQFIYFYNSGINLVFYPTSIFSEPRNFDGVDFFRASGVMAEANALVTTLMLLVVGILNIKGQVDKKLSVLIIFSLVISKSFFGWLLIPFFMYASNCFSYRQVFGVGLAAILVFVLYIDVSVFIYRIENFSDDPSFQARLGIDTIQNSFFYLLVPGGFSSADTSKIAVNGFIYLFNAMGMFALIFIFLMYRLLNCKRAFLIFMLTLLSYQFFTMQLFWAVIGLVSSRRKDA
ncbi:MAG: hypothetical protein RPR97_16370 [Colwellia sp.]|jgi:hypothetical protein